MLSIWQVIIITILAFLVPIDKYGMTLGLRWPIIPSFFMGLILGDMGTAMYVGGTLQLMSLGVASIGGSSVPEYSTAAIIAIVIAVVTGSDLDAGMAAGLAIGIPVAMLGVQLDVFAKMLNGFVVRRSQKYAEEKQFDKMINILYIGPVIMGLTAAVPVFIAIQLGPDVIDAILAFMPTWFTGGLTIAGKALPAAGIALLLNYMPTKKYGFYLLIGFFFAAYLNVPILGVTILGIVASMKHYMDQQKFATSQGAGMNGGGLEDE